MKLTKAARQELRDILASLEHTTALLQAPTDKGHTKAEALGAFQLDSTTTTLAHFIVTH